MLSFFIVLLILIGANALFMIFSLTGTPGNGKKFQGNLDRSGASIVKFIRDFWSHLKGLV